MQRVDIDITLHLRGPFLTKSTAPGDYGLDEVVARDAQGRVYIAGTHVAGKLREAWEELRDALGESEQDDQVPTEDGIVSLLGKQLDESDAYTPRAKRLYFSDFVLRASATGRGVRYRIEIDDQLGAAKKGMQLVLESPFAAGEVLVFDGRLCFLTPDDQDRERIRNQVECGLQWTPQMGALRSIGFGRLIQVEISDVSSRPVEVRKREWNGAAGFDLLIRPDAPFCIAQTGTADNLYVSSEDIPGNVILGALARSLNLLCGKTESPNRVGKGDEGDNFNTLREYFSQIHVTHAFPAAGCLQRPVRPPLSLVKVGGALYDTALLDDPALIKGEAPAFSVDWKKSDDVDRRYGWPNLGREMRVRTAIDSRRLRSHQGLLFAHEMIVPDKGCWLARVYCGTGIEDDERKSLLDQLAALLEIGLFGLGKTRTTAQTTIEPVGTVKNVFPNQPVAPGLGVDGLLIITLQTPALLCSPEHLDETSGMKALWEAYEAAWQSLCRALTLQRYFAQQRLAGGKYQLHRFQGGNEYRPWLLTEAGSVFVFSVQDRLKVREKVAEWCSLGLPLPDEVKAYYSRGGQSWNNDNALWEHCPYVRQNGYGEIAVNLTDHERLCPEPSDITPIERLLED